MVSEDELRKLAQEWEARAMSLVPAEYANRNLHHKYLKEDNEACGLQDCAIELLSLLDRARLTRDEAARGEVLPVYRCSGCGTLAAFIPDDNWPHCIECQSSAWMPAEIKAV